MTLKDYANKLGIGYRTAWNHFKAGKIPNAYQLETGTIIVPEENTDSVLEVAIYTRVSSNENKNNLETQLDRVSKWATLNGFYS